MKQIVDKLNKIAKKINENVELSDRDLIIDSLDSITKAYGGTPNDSTLIVDKLDDIYNNISPAVSGNIEITENGENINVAPFATATVNVSGGGGGGDLTTATLKVVVPEGVSSDYIMGCFVMPAVPDQTPDTSFYQSTPFTTGTNEYQVILYKGGAVLVINQTVRSVSGDITSISGDSYFMTGDCTVTLSSGGGN